MIQPFFDFIRYCLNDQAPVPENLSEMDWQGLFDFAYKQAILGIIYYGIQRLPKDAPRPDVDLELKWFAISEQIRKNNIALNMVCGKLTRDLLKDGFRSCILKGQGNALMYPDPYIRTSGDIDIWLDGTPKDIVAYARKRVPDAEIGYHHVDYPIIKDVEIELHYRPIYFKNLFKNKKLQKYIQANAEEQFSHLVDLPDNYGTISAPTFRFNVIFQITHVFKHFINEGVGIRQLIDLYYLLNEEHSAEDVKDINATLKQFGLYTFASGIMYLLYSLFGLNPDKHLMEPDKSKGTYILSDIIELGNFGHTDNKYNRQNSGRAKSTFLKIKRVLRHAITYPSESLAIIPFRLYEQYYVAGLK